MPKNQFAYVGGELELFSRATNWKSYVADTVLPYLGARVLEVGAGIGSTTQSLCARHLNVDRWVALEPDPQLAAQIKTKIERNEIPEVCEVIEGTIASLPASERFDTVLYMDVLEHIEHDDVELATAASRLAPHGKIIVLAPAHQGLFTPFDAAIGHYRRYDLAALHALTPPSLTCVKAGYLDAVGLIASWCNKRLLKSSQPSTAQILLWDRVMVRASKVADRAFNGRIGKSAIMVWEKLAFD